MYMQVGSKKCTSYLIIILTCYYLYQSLLHSQSMIINICQSLKEDNYVACLSNVVTEMSKSWHWFLDWHIILMCLYIEKRRRYSCCQIHPYMQEMIPKDGCNIILRIEAKFTSLQMYFVVSTCMAVSTLKKLWSSIDWSPQ